MVCTSCTPTLKVPTCTTTLIIGQSDFASTDIYIFFKNINTGYQHRQEATTDSIGIVTADLTDPSTGFYNEFQVFELWATFRDTTTTDKLPVWIAGEFFTCFEVRFEKIIENPPVSYATHTLTLDEDYTAIIPTMEYDGGRGVVLENLDTTVRTWEDQSGNNHDATQSNNAVRPTKNGNLIEFGGGDALDIADFAITRTYIHIMALFRMDSNTAPFATFQDILTQWNGVDTAGQAFALYLDGPSNDIYWDVFKDNSTLIKSKSVENITLLNNWVFIEGIFDGVNSTHDLYVNGIRREQHSYQDDEVDAFSDVTTPIIIGAHFTGVNSYSEFFKGDMRHIRVYSSALSATQRQREILEIQAKV